MTNLSAEEEAMLQRIDDRIEAIARDIAEIKVGVERLVQAIIGESEPESLPTRAVLREERSRKRQAMIASGDASTSIKDAVLKPAQTRMVERWKFRTAMAIAVVSTLTAIAIALVK